MKIVIVGGGTAGWLAAFMLSKIYKQNVTVIESSKIDIIGVGEGGTHVLGTIINTLNEFGFSDTREFMEATDATPKLGVQHIGWPSTYYLPLDLLPNREDEDFLPLLMLNKKPLHLVSELGILIEHRVVPIKSDETGIWDTSDWSFHFDGRKVGLFFKNKCSDVVNIIDSVVTEVILDTNGKIEKLRLDNEQFETADLFIDCTGFQKILMSALETKWISYADSLLVNTAIPFSLDWHDVIPLTKASALSSGWTWNIPTRYRQGMGYVYSDKFISYENAVKELEDTYKYYGKINPIRTIKFEAGRLEKIWNKNCVALGLASAFVEPLEATSIHATKIQIDELGKMLIQGNTNSDLYNKNIIELYDEIKDFIVLHYLGNKTNSDFWKYCNSNIATDRVNNILEIAQHRFLTADDIPNKLNNLSYRAWNQVLAGLNKFNYDNIKISDGMQSRYNSWYNKILTKSLDYKSLDDCIEKQSDWWLPNVKR